MSIVFTTNLGMFKFHESNRDFTNPESQNRIKRIAQSMKEDGVLPHAIVVTSKYIVVDGQHRLEAARIAEKGIWFMVDDTISNTAKGIFQAAKKYNRDAKVWGKGDYLNGLAKQGNENYQILDDFRKKYPMFSQTEAEMLLMNSGTKSMGKVAFGDGKFVVKDLKKATELANNLISLKPYFQEGYNRSVFVRTILTIIERKPEFSFDRFLHKVKLRPGMIYLCGDKRAYSEMIEELYNYRAHTADKLTIRF